MRFLTFIFCILLSFSAIGQQNVPYAEAAYVCPPCNSKCDELGFAKAGTCQHCGMELITKVEALKYHSNMKQLRIAFYLQPGVEILDFAGPMEVFAYAGYKVFTVSLTKDPLVSQGILTIKPDYSIEDAPEADILAFFGGNSGAGFADPAITEWIKKQDNIQYYFSVCTGAFALGKAGILDGHTATTFHDALEGLERDFPKVKVVKNARFVDNGTVITTAGVSAGIDGALHLVAKLQGFNRARQTAYYMEYDKWTPGDGLVLTEEN
ncbi:MAG: DJ-1/PfpI family protein, partial [Bacteroidota bacterium]